MNPKSPRVAIVHDWLLGMRGGERVLESLLRIYPNADIYTLFYDPEGVSIKINMRSIRASALHGWPGVRRYYRYLLPLMPWAMGRLPLRHDYDLVISTSHCVAHGIDARGARHIVYCFSPMRYLYDKLGAYADGGAGLGMLALERIAPALRRWDRSAAKRASLYIGISRAVTERIRDAYDINAELIYPPARTDFFTPAHDQKEKYNDKNLPWLVVSALVPYKRVDLAVQAAALVKEPLKIVGEGPLIARLRRLAPSNVEFAGRVDDVNLRECYRNAKGLIFPGEEDFGIIPVEAMACGLPVLALRAGGLTETNIEGKTGSFFDHATPETLADALKRFNPAAYETATLRRRAEEFSEDRFIQKFSEAVKPVYVSN